MAEDAAYAAFHPRTRRCVLVTSILSDAVEHLEKGFIVRQVTHAQARTIWGETVTDVYRLEQDHG